jgi:hypothetical protein
MRDGASSTSDKLNRSGIVRRERRDLEQLTNYNKVLHRHEEALPFLRRLHKIRITTYPLSAWTVSKGNVHGQTAA